MLSSTGSSVETKDGSEEGGLKVDGSFVKLLLGVGVVNSVTCKVVIVPISFISAVITSSMLVVVSPDRVVLVDKDSEVAGLNVDDRFFKLISGVGVVNSVSCIVVTMPISILSVVVISSRLVVVSPNGVVVVDKDFVAILVCVVSAS